MTDCRILVNGTNKTVEHFSFSPVLAKNGSAFECDGGLSIESKEKFQYDQMASVSHLMQNNS